MKILIAFDGSECSEAALDDLMTAGLPGEAEVVVMSVAEVWLPPENAGENGEEFKPDPYLENLMENHRQKARKAVAEAATLAGHARERILKMFPAWKAKSEATFGSPAWEILIKAGEMKADLIVVGSHGRTAAGRFFLGSISNKVLTEARCSVRVARGRVEVDPPSPSRIVIGFDGSPGANAAVEAVADRFWREQSEVHLIAVSDPITPSAIGRFVPPIVNWVEEANAGEREWLEKLAEIPLQKLREAGLSTTFSIEAGNPKQILVEAAANWHADAIFVGANRFANRVERFLLGSVSAAVAARAHCSVEVIRKQE